MELRTPAPAPVDDDPTSNSALPRPQPLHLGRNRIIRNEWRSRSLMPRFNLAAMQLEQPTAPEQWTPALLEDRATVLQEDKIIDKSRIKAFGKEEAYAVLGEYQRLLKIDHNETLKLMASTCDPENKEALNVEDFNLLQGAFSYSALIGFNHYLRNLDSRLRILSDRIADVIARHKQADVPVPVNYTDLEEMILESLKTRGQTFIGLHNLIVAYEPLLTNAMSKLDIPVNKNDTIEHQECYFNQAIKEMLTEEYKDPGLLEWYDRSCANTRYLLNLLIADVGESLLNQDVNIPTKHQLICQTLFEEWKLSSEYQSAITVGNP